MAWARIPLWAVILAAATPVGSGGEVGSVVGFSFGAGGRGDRYAVFMNRALKGTTEDVVTILICLSMHVMVFWRRER